MLAIIETIVIIEIIIACLMSVETNTKLCRILAIRLGKRDIIQIRSFHILVKGTKKIG
jgi:hypothetical protein